MPSATPPVEPSELTDEAVQKLLAGESTRGPRKFRGRELAPYKAGLRDLVMKVVRPQDTAILHDVVVIYILTEAHGTDPADCLARRRALITETDDVEAFRAKVSIELMDDLGDEEIAEARRLVDDILKPVQLAQVAVVAQLGKKKPAARAKPNPTTKSS